MYIIYIDFLSDGSLAIKLYSTLTIHYTGLLLGYALKKVVKVLAVIVGLFVAGLAYLQYQQIASFNWDRIECIISKIANTTTNTFNDHNIESLATTNLGIPLTGGMSAGFAIGFMKG